MTCDLDFDGLEAVRKALIFAIAEGLYLTAEERTIAVKALDAVYAAMGVGRT